MEPDAKRLLKRVISTVSFGSLWLLTNMTFGIYLGWMFFEERMTPGNYMFYGFMLASLISLIRYLIRLWKD